MCPRICIICGPSVADLPTRGHSAESVHLVTKNYGKVSTVLASVDLWDRSNNRETVRLHSSASGHCAVLWKPTIRNIVLSPFCCSKKMDPKYTPLLEPKLCNYSFDVTDKRLADTLERIDLPFLCLETWGLPLADFFDSSPINYQCAFHIPSLRNPFYVLHNVVQSLHFRFVSVS